MKIRQDFVTNSSSSSFMLIIKLDLKNGEKISYNSGWYSVEQNGEIEMNVSPKQLGKCSTVDELASMLRGGIYYPKWNDEEEHKDTTVCEVNTAEWFIQQILDEVTGMDEITKITISGNEEYRTGHEWNRRYSYDRTNGQYTARITGGVEESEGGGGGIYFSDIYEAEITGDSSLYASVRMTVLCDDGYQGEFVWESSHKEILAIKYSPKQLGSCKTLSELKEKLAEEFSNNKKGQLPNPIGDGLLDLESVKEIVLETWISLKGEQMVSSSIGDRISQNETYKYNLKTRKYSCINGGKGKMYLRQEDFNSKKTGIILLFEDKDEAESYDESSVRTNKIIDNPVELISETEKLYVAELLTDQISDEIADSLHVGQKVIFTASTRVNYGFVNKVIDVQVKTGDSCKTIGTIDYNLSRELISAGAENLKGRIVLLRTNSKNGKKIIPPQISVEITARISSTDTTEIKKPDSGGIVTKRLEEENKLQELYFAFYQTDVLIFTGLEKKVFEAEKYLFDKYDTIVIDRAGYSGKYSILRIRQIGDAAENLLKEPVLISPETEMYYNSGADPGYDGHCFYSLLGSDVIDQAEYHTGINGNIDNRCFDERIKLLTGDLTRYRVIIELKSGEKKAYEPRKDPVISFNKMKPQSIDLSRIADRCYGDNDEKKDVFVKKFINDIGNFANISKITCVSNVRTKSVSEDVQQAVNDTSLFNFISSYVEKEERTVYDFEANLITRKEKKAAFTVDPEKPAQLDETILDVTEETENVILGGYDERFKFAPKYNQACCTECLCNEHVIEVPAMTNNGTKVIAIGDHCFDNCTNVRKIILPPTVVWFGRDAFSKCRKLQTIVYSTDPDTPVKIEKISNSYDRVILKSVCSIEDTYEVPEQINEIGDAAFGGCPKLETLILRKGRYCLSVKAFRGCRSLKTVKVSRKTAFQYDYTNLTQALANSDVKQLYVDEKEITFIDPYLMECISEENRKLFIDYSKAARNISKAKNKVLPVVSYLAQHHKEDIQEYASDMMDGAVRYAIGAGNIDMLTKLLSVDLEYSLDYTELTDMAKRLGKTDISFALLNKSSTPGVSRKQSVVKEEPITDIAPDQLYIKVRFEDNKTYMYFCRFAVKVGDRVYVQGKKAGLPGEVSEILSDTPKGRAASYTLNVERAYRLTKQEFEEELDLGDLFESFDMEETEDSVEENENILSESEETLSVEINEDAEQFEEPTDEEQTEEAAIAENEEKKAEEVKTEHITKEEQSTPEIGETVVSEALQEEEARKAAEEAERIAEEIARKEKEQIEAERKLNEELTRRAELARIEEIRLYTEALKKWEADCEKIKAERSARVEELIETEKKRLFGEATQKKEAVCTAANTRIAEETKRKSEAEKKLSALGLFKFGEKKQQKAIIENASQMIEKAKKDIENAEHIYQSEIAAIETTVDKKISEFLTQAEIEFPMPEEPAKPQEES